MSDGSVEKRSVAVIVSHTHWDREWYLTFHRFRTNLVRIIGRVLELLETEPRFRHFLLDGQAILLEDYLDVNSEDAGRIERLVRSGRLAVGPWYILPDEFLVSAESTVRNLLYGHAVGERFGGVQAVGYMPDSFGHIAQMPQILRRSGIDSFVYTRGDGKEIGAEHDLQHVWTAPDGSDVLAVHQLGGYCNAAVLGLEEIWHGHTRREIDTGLAVQRVTDLLARMKPINGGSVFLLNNGCDHLPPQPRIPEIAVALAAALPEVDFVHGSLEEYLSLTREENPELKRRSGELRWGRLHHVLSGVWSARMYLKQMNDAAQTMLTRYAEPLSSYSHFMLGQRYPDGELDSAWKLLLQNHPHDSICGCSTDEVHRAMVPRFGGVTDTCDQLMRNHLEEIAHTFARNETDDRDTVLSVFNPLPRKRDALVRRLVVLQPLDYQIDRLRLIDDEGEMVPFRVLDTTYVERFWGIDYRTELFEGDQRERFGEYATRFADRYLKQAEDRDTADLFLTIEFIAHDLPPVGHSNFRLTDSGPAGTPGAMPSTVRVEGTMMNNGLCEVLVHPDGTFDLKDLETAEVFEGLNLFVDVEDIGDEYDYSPCANNLVVDSKGAPGDVRVVENTGLTATVEARLSLDLPAAIVPDRSARSREVVACDVVTRVTLRPGSRVVEVSTTIDNRASDHRLRVEFPAGIQTDTIVSDGHFLIDHRPIEAPDGTDWVQPPGDAHPQQEFSLLQEPGRGLVVFNRGLPEIAVSTGTEGSGLSLTLLRCVEWLSRDDFPTRRNQNAGPTLFTPEAQCHGPHRFEYAVMPFAGDYRSARVKEASEEYRTVPPVIQGVADGLSAGGNGLVEVSGDGVVVTALKKHRVRDTLVLRLCNLHPEMVTGSIVPGARVGEAWRIDMLEMERLGPLAVTDGGVGFQLDLGSHEIATVELVFDGD